MHLEAPSAHDVNEEFLFKAAASATVASYVKSAP